MNGGLQLVVFRLDELRCALPLSVVDRVVRVVDVTPLAGAPGVVRGVINVQGRVVPVFDLRRRFALPERDIRLDDQLVLARTAARDVALLVDGAEGVIQCGEDAATRADRVWPGISPVAGVLKQDDGLVLIHDLEAFLSDDEHRAMEAALAAKPRMP